MLFVQLAPHHLFDAELLLKSAILVFFTRNRQYTKIKACVQFVESLKIIFTKIQPKNYENDLLGYKNLVKFIYSCHAR